MKYGLKISLFLSSFERWKLDIDKCNNRLQTFTEIYQMWPDLQQSNIIAHFVKFYFIQHSLSTYSGECFSKWQKLLELQSYKEATPERLINT